MKNLYKETKLDVIHMTANLTIGAVWIKALAGQA